MKTPNIQKKQKKDARKPPKKETRLDKTNGIGKLKSNHMNSKICAVTVGLFISFLSTITNADDFTNLCQEDGANAGLTGSELNDYVASCVSQYGADEPTYEEYEQTEYDYSNEYVEDDTSGYSDNDQ